LLLDLYELIEGKTYDYSLVSSSVEMGEEFIVCKVDVKPSKIKNDIPQNLKITKTLSNQVSKLVPAILD
jgi:hypothetical protein